MSSALALQRGLAVILALGNLPLSREVIATIPYKDRVVRDETVYI